MLLLAEQRLPDRFHAATLDKAGVQFLDRPGRREAARFPLVLPPILFDVKFTETTGHILDIAFR